MLVRSIQALAMFSQLTAIVREFGNLTRNSEAGREMRKFVVLQNVTLNVRSQVPQHRQQRHAILTNPVKGIP